MLLLFLIVVVGFLGMLITFAWSVGTRRDMLLLKQRIEELEAGNDILDENLDAEFDEQRDDIKSNMDRITGVERNWINIVGKISDNEAGVAQLKESLIEANKELLRILKTMSEMYQEIKEIHSIFGVLLPKAETASRRAEHAICRIPQLQEEIDELKLKPVRKIRKKKPSNKKA